MTDSVFNSSPVSAANWWTSIRAAFHVSKPSWDQASFQMLSLARSNLGVKLRAIEQASLVSETQKNIYSSVTDMLAGPVKTNSVAGTPEWDEIYKAENMIALLYGGEQLRQETGARLQELANSDQVRAEAFQRDYQEQFKRSVDGLTPGADDSTLRMFLLRVMDALHWSEKKKYLAYPLRVQATNRILVCLLVSFVLLILPYGLIVLDYSVASSPVHKLWSLLALYTALSAGLLGAFSSRLYGIQHQWADMSLDEVSLQREWTYTFLRAGVGVCGALVIYIFLRSGIAEGALFPKFDEIGIELVPVADHDKVEVVQMAFTLPSKAMALLTFWCFLAGISETLVPSILKSTEQKLTDVATSEVRK
jgi:hypothetical protein